MFVGCGKDEPTTNDTPFTFLKVGHEWIYESYYDDLPNDIWKIVITSELNNFYKIDYYDYYEGSWDDCGNKIWYSNGEYWKIGVSGIFENDGVIILYRNSYVGQKWDTTITVSDYGYSVTETHSSEVLSISETITVPAGTFTDCIKVKVEDIRKFFWDGEDYEVTNYEYYWIHKNVGIVMSEDNEGRVDKLKSKNF